MSIEAIPVTWTVEPHGEAWILVAGLPDGRAYEVTPPIASVAALFEAVRLALEVGVPVDVPTGPGGTASLGTQKTLPRREG